MIRVGLFAASFDRVSLTEDLDKSPSPGEGERCLRMAPVSSPFAITAEAASYAYVSWSTVLFLHSVGSLSKRKRPVLYSVVLHVHQKGEENK